MPGMDMSPPKSLWDLSFFELWHPVLLLALIVIGVVYIRAVVRRDQKPILMKTLSLLLSLAVFYLSEGSPLTALGHDYLFSAHMLSMSLTYFVVPPLFLGGVYDWMVDPLVGRPLIKMVINKITHPLLAVSIFNLLLSFYHVPVIFNWIMSKMIYMNLALIILLFFAFVMWWVVIQPTEKTRSISDLQKLGYIFVASILLTPACAMITFANHFLYIKTASEHLSIVGFSPLEDQSTGGVIMKVVQELVFICTFGYIFYKWNKKDNPRLDNDLNPKFVGIKQTLPTLKSK